MLKELCEYLVGVGRAETPKFVAVPGRPDLAVEVEGGKFGRLWPAARATSVVVPTFAGLGQFLQSIAAEPPTTIEATADHAAVEVLARWMGPGASGVIESRSAELPIALSPEAETIRRLIVDVEASPRVFSVPALVDLLSRQVGVGVADKAKVDAFRLVDFSRLSGAKVSQQRGVEAFGRTVEARVQNVEALPSFVDVAIELSPQVPGGRVTTFRIHVEPRPADEVFAVWVEASRWIDALAEFSAVVRDRAQAAFVAVENVPVIAGATVVLGSSRRSYVVESSTDGKRLRR